MEASELRIGNIINQGAMYGEQAIEAYQIYNYSLFEKGGKVAEYYKDWQPIELTEEWIEKIGFEFFDYGVADNIIMREYFLNKSITVRYKICLNSDGFNEFSIEVMGREMLLNGDVRYLHQLQNLYFAITGEELQIS